MSCDDYDGCLTVPRPCAAANIWVWAIIAYPYYSSLRIIAITVVRPCKDLDSRGVVWDNLKIINGKWVHNSKNNVSSIIVAYHYCHTTLMNGNKYIDIIIIQTLLWFIIKLIFLLIERHDADVWFCKLI